MASKGAKPADRASGRSKPADRASRGGSFSVGSAVRPHAPYIWSLAAVVAGLLVAGSVWMSAAGPVGEGIDWILAQGVGLVRSALPVGLVALGAVAFHRARRIDPKRRLRPDSAGESGGGAEPPAAPAPRPDPDSMVRVMLGGLLLVVAASGLLHLARGRPGVGDPVEEIGAAGGVLGVAVGGLLHAWTATWGAVLLLVFAGLVGVIVITRGSVVAAAEAVLAAVRKSVLALARLTWRVLRAAVVKLFSDIKEAPAGREATGLPQYEHPEVAPVRADPDPGDAALDDEPPAAAEPGPRRGGRGRGGGRGGRLSRRKRSPRLPIPRGPSLRARAARARSGATARPSGGCRPPRSSP